VALFAASARGETLGAVKLDNYTFDKMVELSTSSGSSLLVKFDEIYAALWRPLSGLRGRVVALASSTCRCSG